MKSVYQAEVITSLKLFSCALNNITDKTVRGHGMDFVHVIHADTKRLD